MQANPLADATRREVLARIRVRAESLVATLEYLDGRAEIEEADGRRRAAEQRIRLSTEIRLHLLEGEAMVRLDDGSDVWLRRGSVLSLAPWKRDARVAELRGGRALFLVAPDSARPFCARAPWGEVRVAGTAFDVAAEPARGGDIVGVYHGVVHVGIDGCPPARVAANQAASIEDSAEMKKRIVVRRSHGQMLDCGAFTALDGLSGANGRIREAAAAVSRARTSHGVDSMSIGNKSIAKRALLAGLVVLAVAGGVWWLADSGRSPEPAAGGSSTSSAGNRAPNGAASPAGEKPLVFTTETKPRQRKDGRQPAPPPPGLTDQELAIFMREFDAISASFVEMKRAGTKPVDAARKAEAAAAGSIRKQFEAAGLTPPAGVRLAVRLLENDDIMVEFAQDKPANGSRP